MVALVAGCATGKREDAYALPSDPIGVAVTSTPNRDLARVQSAAGIGFLSGAIAPGKGAEILGPMAILLAPFTAAYGAAEGASCDQKIDAAFPGLSVKFPVIVQRELSLEDLQDQLVGRLQNYTSAPVARDDIRDRGESAASAQQLVAAAAEDGQANLFLIEVSSVTIGPWPPGHCDQWRIIVRFAVQLWRVADRKLMRSFSEGAAIIGSPENLRSVLEAPGELRSQLAPKFAQAAERVILSGKLELPR